MIVARPSHAAPGTLSARLVGLFILSAALLCLPVADARLLAQPNGLGGFGVSAQPQSIDEASLMAAQPALVAAAVKDLGPARRGKPQVFTISIAPGGSQALFGREARAVQNLFTDQLGQKSPSIVLSNARLDLFNAPLANRENLAAVLAAIGKRFDPDRDMLLLYMTAHGAPQAWVQTDLPDETQLEPIDANFLADELAKAGIRRRILVISACFSGAWIPALESPDTIVLTAASAFRTSFGCDDRREFTWYGAALINGGLRYGLSWHAAYDELAATIMLEEQQMGVPASKPMADVGEHMVAVWDAPLRAYPPR